MEFAPWSPLWISLHFRVFLRNFTGVPRPSAQDPWRKKRLWILKWPPCLKTPALIIRAQGAFKACSLKFAASLCSRFKLSSSLLSLWLLDERPPKCAWNQLKTSHLNPSWDINYQAPIMIFPWCTRAAPVCTSPAMPDAGLIGWWLYQIYSQRWKRDSTNCRVFSQFLSPGGGFNKLLF